MNDDTRDRVIRLEAVVAQQTVIIDKMDIKVTEMHTLLTQARGVRWTILAMAAFGGFVAAKFSAFMAFFGR